MHALAVTVYLVCLALSREFTASSPHSVDEMIRDHGLPVFAANDARVENRRWVLWAGYWPTRAARLVTTGLHPVESKEEAQKLDGGVLFYCSEPAPWRSRGDLLLWTFWVGAKMARAAPYLDQEGPNARLKQQGAVNDPGNAPFLPLSNPMKCTLVFLDRRGRPDRARGPV